MSIFSNFDAFDYTLMGILLFFVIIGFVRGFFKEALVLIFFVATLWLAYLYTPHFATYFDDYISSDPVKYWLTFVLFVFLAWLLGVILISFITKSVNFTSLKTIDKPLGAIMGFLRGVLMASLLIVVGTNTSWAEKDWWKNSVSRPYFEPISNKIETLLPIFNNDDKKDETE